MKPTLFVAIFLLLAASLATLSRTSARSGQNSVALRSAQFHAARVMPVIPRYDSRGSLVRPQNFETWIFVGASTGLAYEPGTRSSGPGEFHNVYITPAAYDSYLRSGKFPEKTMLALALYDPSEKISPAKAGYFEGNFAALAIAVKDHSHSPEGWSYYTFGDAGHLLDAAPASPKSACYACHFQHALDDNVFVQFYPVLRGIRDARR